MPEAPRMENPFTGEPHRLPLIVGMDPGAHKGYALGDCEDIVERKGMSTPRIVGIATTLKTIERRLANGLDAKRRPVWSMIELQYTARITAGEISAESIVKLAFRAGFMLREAHALPGAEEMFAAPPNAWKTTIFNNGSGYRKDIFCEKIKRQLLDDERYLLAQALEPYPEAERATRALDLLDGVGITWALYLAMMQPDAGDLLAQWRVWPDRILPKSSKTTRKPNKAARDKLRI